MIDEEITIYSDYICPFCYLGRVSLDTVEERRGDRFDLDWRPFDLRRHRRGPDGELDDSVTDIKDESYYEKARENVRRLREEYGADDMLDPGAVSLEIDSLPAQIVSMHVQEAYPDRWRAFDGAIFATHWEDGRDIGDEEVLADIGQSVDLPPSVVDDALGDDALGNRVQEAFAAAENAGITGVPAFIYDERVARGAVPPEHLEQLVETDREQVAEGT